MSFLILKEFDKHCLAVMCDHCGERITRASDGNGVWLEFAKNGPPLQHVMHTHKRCHRAFERHLSEGKTAREVCTSELSDHLIELEHNLYFGDEDRKRAAQHKGLMNLLP